MYLDINKSTEIIKKLYETLETGGKKITGET